MHRKNNIKHYINTNKYNNRQLRLFEIYIFIAYPQQTLPIGFFIIIILAMRKKTVVVVIKKTSEEY